MTTIKGILFFIITSIQIIIYVGYVIILEALNYNSLHDRIRIRQRLGRRIIAINGVQREVKGKVPKGVFLFISNHRTYMDPIMQAPEAAFIPVAMQEIESWPFIGSGTRASGVVFVKREKKSSRAATRIAVAKAIEDGYSVIIYPEGGTNDLTTTATFREGIFKLAAEKGIPLIPIAVDYEDTSFYWTNGMSFVGHIINTFGKKMNVKVHYGEPIYNEDYKALLEDTRSWIDKALLQMRSEWEAK